MVSMRDNRQVSPLAWAMTLACLLPLWLFSTAITVEGFPSPPISLGLAYTAFFGAIGVGILLVWRGWMTLELILYSLLPFVLMFAFDEISTNYKTPFIFMCALILSAGVVGYLHSRPVWLRWVMLLVAAAVFFAAAWHAANSFWDLAGELGAVRCFPDTAGCITLSVQAHPWWSVFFSF